MNTATPAAPCTSCGSFAAADGSTLCADCGTAHVGGEPATSAYAVAAVAAAPTLADLARAQDDASLAYDRTLTWHCGAMTLASRAALDAARGVRTAASSALDVATSREDERIRLAIEALA